MNQGDGHNAPLHILEQGNNIVILDRRGLQRNQTGDYIQIIFGAMIEFAQQSLYILKRRLELLFGLFAFRYILGYAKAAQ